METLRNELAQVSDSVVSTLKSVNMQDTDELSKEKEDELLYGSGEYGDEEEALSDDSLRLRLSDDEEETENVTSSLDIEFIEQQGTQIELELINHSKNQKSSNNLHKSISKNVTAKNEVLKKEERKAGNKHSEKYSINNVAFPHSEKPNVNVTHETTKYEINVINKKTKSVMLNNKDLDEKITNNSFVKRDMKSTEKNRINQLVPTTDNNCITEDHKFKEGTTRSDLNGSLCLYDKNNITDQMETDLMHNLVSDLDNCKEVDNFEKKEISSNISIKCQVSKEKLNGSVKTDIINKDSQIIQCILGTANNNNKIKMNVSFEKKDTDITEICHSEMQEEIKEIIDKEQKNDRSYNLKHSSAPKKLNQEQEILKILQSNFNSTISEYIKNISSDSQDVDSQSDISNKKEESKCNLITKLKNSIKESLQGNLEKDNTSEHSLTSNNDIINDSLSEKVLSNKTNNIRTVKSTQNEDILSNLETITSEIEENKSNNCIDTVKDANVTKMHCLSKQSEKMNLSNVLPDKNIMTNSNETKLKATNLGDNVNEALISIDESSSTSKTVSSESPVNSKNVSDDTEKKKVDTTTTTRRRRRTRKMLLIAREDITQDDNQVLEMGRQKRRTAKNAEEIIRKKFLNHDSDLESSDGSDKFVIINHKMKQHARSLSPPSLKRICPDNEASVINNSVKKVKINSEISNDDMSQTEINKEIIKDLNYVQQFFQRDLKEKLPKLKQEELEELLIQKIVESITMRGEIGRLREQARISEKNQEATRTRCQQLAKQIKDFEMVLSRNAADRRANNDKPTAPIKINRSVGLQVNFMTEHGMQNLKQLHQNSNLKSINITNGVNLSGNETVTNVVSPRRGIKIRSPRRLEIPVVTQSITVPQSPIQPPTLVSTVTPAALVVSKTVESQHALPLSNQSHHIQQLIPNQQQLQQQQSQSQSQQQQQQQTIVLNGKISNQTGRQSAALNISKPKTNDLIDLTDEEEKNKAAVNMTSGTTTSITDQTINIASKTQNCFQRVIQTLPANVAIASQPPSIRVVQTANHPTPTALNNMNAPRLAYVMQSGVGSTRQLLITSNANQMRPVTSCTKSPFSTLTYKTGISTVANGTVRVLTTSAAPNLQLNKHPAPLPDPAHVVLNSVWKLPPPAPSLKISKVANGIVLSWNMTLSDKYADIASYQLYAYQEVAGVSPSTTLWKKVGDVRALPLPMACTLTQFSEGNNYYFAVRAVDTHSRKGQYSIPGNISL